MYPVIEYLNINKEFKYLWLKYITGIDLSVHCAKTFKGVYSKKIDKTSENNMVVLDEVDLSKCEHQFYYLCGVSSPYVYEYNFHLAFVYKKGSTIHVNRNGIEIKIQDACELEITPNDIDTTKREAQLPTFFTCRNWQFANTIRRIITQEIQITEKEVQ